MYPLNAQKLQTVHRRSYQTPPWEFLPIHGSWDLYQRIPPRGGREAGARCSTTAPTLRMPGGMSVMSDAEEASHGSTSFTTLGAREDSIDMSSLENHVSLHIYQSELQRKIQNKSQHNVFFNHACITLAASRELGICEATATSLKSPQRGRRELGVTFSHSCPLWNTCKGAPVRSFPPKEIRKKRVSVSILEAH